MLSSCCKRYKHSRQWQIKILNTFQICLKRCFSSVLSKIYRIYFLLNFFWLFVTIYCQIQQGKCTKVQQVLGNTTLPPQAHLQNSPYNHLSCSCRSQIILDSCQTSDVGVAYLLQTSSSLLLTGSQSPIKICRSLSPNRNSLPILVLLQLLVLWSKKQNYSHAVCLA